MPVLMTSAIPIFRIFSKEKAVEFYVDFLGFTIDWEHKFVPDAPVCIQIHYGDLILHLDEHHGDSGPGSHIYVQMTGLDEYHQTLNAKKYGNLRLSIEPMPWGSNVMEVIDPFGNRIRFGESPT